MCDLRISTVSLIVLIYIWRRWYLYGTGITVRDKSCFWTFVARWTFSTPNPNSLPGTKIKRVRNIAKFRSSSKGPVRGTVPYGIFSFPMLTVTLYLLFKGLREPSFELVEVKILEHLLPFPDVSQPQFLVVADVLPRLNAREFRVRRQRQEHLGNVWKRNRKQLVKKLT